MEDDDGDEDSGMEDDDGDEASGIWRMMRVMKIVVYGG